MAAADVKISCRNVWKVFGEDPSRFFPGGDGQVPDPASHYEHILGSAHLPAACDVSFEVREGEMLVIMGLSGSGKSTVVRCLSRLIEPTAGHVLLDGEDLMQVDDRELIEIRRHKMGMVFQHFGLLPHLTVLENVAFPLKIQGVPQEERERQAREVIDLVALAGREHSMPSQLSGGQQQRVGLARSLAVKPELWLLDEPFSALDPLIRAQMQDEFIRLQKILKKTVIFITHDFQEALRLADRIAIMKDGWIEQIAKPADIIRHPATDYVSRFTRGAPCGSVLTAGDVVEPLAETVVPAGEVAARTILDELIPYLSDQEQPVAVVDENRRRIGQVTARGVLGALASVGKGRA